MPDVLNTAGVNGWMYSLPAEKTCCARKGLDTRSKDSMKRLELLIFLHYAQIKKEKKEDCQKSTGNVAPGYTGVT